jgi:hypothetical protein
MSFVTILSKSISADSIGILIFVDSLKILRTNLPWWNSIHVLQLALNIFKHVIYKHGIPDNIVTDSSTQLTSWC